GAAAWDLSISTSLCLLVRVLACAVRTGQPAREKLQRALPGERGGGRVVARPLIAIEAVAGTVINVEDALRVRGLQQLHLIQRDAAVGRAEVIHDRTPGCLGSIPRIAVVND